MNSKGKIKLGEKSHCLSSLISCSNNEIMLPPKFPILKSKGRVLADALNRDFSNLSRQSIISKAALQHQRESAQRLASGLSVVSRVDNENPPVTNKQVKPQGKNRKNGLEERKNISITNTEKTLCSKEEVTKIVKKPMVVVKKIKKLEVIRVKEEEKVDPKVKEKVKPKVEPEPEQIPSGVNVIDKEDEHPGNEFLLGYYADDIHKFMKHLESSQPIREDYLTTSHILTPDMRALLVDWLFEVQMSFKLLNETIHLAIALMDLFMQDHPRIARNEIQLVGVSCLFLASKYEEIYPLVVDDLIDVSANTYSRVQILRMEQIIFSSLNFQMGRPSPSQFLKRYGRAGKVDTTTYSLAKYFIDLSLINYCLCHVPPSLMAASALYLSLYLLSNESDTEFWTPSLIYYSQYTWNHMKAVVHKLAAVVWNVPKTKYQSVPNKYLDPKKMHCVSALQELKSEKIYKLAKEV